MSSVPNYRALAEFRHQIRCFLVFSEQAARGVGLEAQQHQLLLAVKGLPEAQRPTIRAISNRLQLRHHSVVELVDRLAARRLVKRKRSTVDGREILIEITPSGDRLLRRLSEAHRAELNRSMPSLVSALDAIVETHS